jgi:molecular chaperone GrpE
MQFDRSPNSEGAPTSSAAHASASDADAPSEEAFAPTGEPEAPAAPAAEESTDPDEESTDPDDDHEAKLEHDLEELTAKAQKADEYLELAQRTKADFENYRRRAAREAAAAQERGVIKLVRELLPAVDNLDRAIAAIGNGSNGDEVVSGIKLVHDEVIAALGRAGVELFSPTGERFDPEHHEAVAQQPADGAEVGTIVEVYQQGCRLGDVVIRPARVVVAG